MRPLHDGASMWATDAAAIAAGVPAARLMETAGTAVAHVTRLRYPGARRVVCVCGGGSNGGDGVVAARVLRALGVDAMCVMVADEPLGEALAGADVIVDALLGTGARGVPRGAVAEAIAAIGRSGAPVVAVDVPSGVDASTGEAAEVCVRADVTVTFHAPKIGHVVMPGRARCGTLVVVPIGIPAACEQPAPARLGAPPVPPRPAFGSKYDAGSVVAVGGSPGMTGAIALAARAALRAGAGIVVAAVPASLNATLEALLVEPMTLPVADDGGILVEAAAERTLERSARAGALLIGPGLGRDPRSAALVRRLAADSDRPLVLDADALQPFAPRAAPTVLTPHAGEAARLLGVGRDEVEARRLESARQIAERFGAVCLLKGADTIIAASDGRLIVRDGDDPRLATAGAGDVLAGTVAALLARGLDAADAAAAAAAAHLAAARSVRPGRAIIASDLVERLALD
jgi:ADP-dependent NAD(P)H-hydrate dehydratase / NAD(P)H-hydrate epimerase